MPQYEPGTDVRIFTLNVLHVEDYEHQKISSQLSGQPIDRMNIKPTRSVTGGKKIRE